MSDKNLMDVIEDLMNESIADDINKITADNQKKKPEQSSSPDTQGVLGSETGQALDAGGDKDVAPAGRKGEYASDASADTQGIEGKTTGAAMDAGGDKDVGVRKSHDQVIPSAASSKVEADKGPHDQANDPGLKEFSYYDMETGEELSEEEVAELEENDLVEFIELESEDELEEWAIVEEESEEELSEEDVAHLYSQMEEEGLFEEDELEEARDMQAARSKGGSKKGTQAAQMKDALTRHANNPNKRSDVTLAGPGGKPLKFVRKAAHGGRYGAEKGSLLDNPLKKGKTTKDAAYDKASNKTDANDMKKAVAKVSKKNRTGTDSNSGSQPNVPVNKTPGEPSSSYKGDGPARSMPGKDQKSAASSSTVKAKKLKPGVADRYGSVQKTGSTNLSKDTLNKMKEDAEYYVEEWDEFFTEEEMNTMVDDGYTFELEEAEGETLKKVSGEANREQRPDHEKGDNEPKTKQEPFAASDHSPHDQGSDPHDTATKANPKGEAASKSTPGGKVTDVKEEDELEEKLHGDQHKLDHNDNNKIDASDMKMVRKKGATAHLTKEEADEEAVEEEDSLDEDFKARAAVIFEATVNEKVATLREEMQVEFDAAISEEKETLNEAVAMYMEEAVQEWLQENALEVKYSLRTEIAENFIRGLKGLFEESYVEIPEEDISVVDELTEAVEDYKEQLEETAAKLAELQQFQLDTQRKDILSAVSEDLTQTQAARLEQLSENIDAADIEEFGTKVTALKEGYFGPESEQPLIGSLTEEVMAGQPVDLQEDNTSVSQYAKFLSKTVLK